MFRALPHFLILLATAMPALAQVYKWVDERGVTHYGERPPQGGKASEVPDRLASPPPGGMAPPAPGGAGGEANRQPRERENPERNRETRQRPAETEAKPSEEANRRQESCNQQRELLARLRQSPQPDTAGAIARQEKLVAEQCKG